MHAHQQYVNMPKKEFFRMQEEHQSEEHQFIELCKVMDTLLGENGCPWDRAQTHQSLRPHLLEEAYEVIDTIDNNDMKGLCEELGDILIHVVIHSRIAEKAGHFTLSDVIQGVSEKLIRRHSHIFADDTASTTADVESTWEANKFKEKDISTTLEYMQAVPKALPALARAQKVIKRSGKEFSEKELIKEVQKQINDPNMANYGYVLFLITVILTKMQINAEFSLTNETQGFINSFK